MLEGKAAQQCKEVPCFVCGKGEGCKLIQFSKYINWVHRRCSGLIEGSKASKSLLSRVCQ